jgi:3-hydroxybutyryl-CoA dehydrogenase
MTTCTLKRATIIGGGTMGHGIAQVSAMAGIHTTLVDLNEDVLKAAEVKVTSNLDKGVARGKVTEEAKTAALANLAFSSTNDSLRESDLFVEAVPENMDLKKMLFKQADAQCPQGAILATNTSSLSVSEIASATSRPQNVIGLHFFNPVHIMKLLEIVKGDQTDADTLARAVAYGQRIGKTHVVVNDAPGFATSRLGICLGNEAMRMVEQGVASAQDIDTAMSLGYGHPVGPLQLTDMVGLDVRLAISTYLYEKLGTDTFKPPAIAQEMVAAGKLGKKSGEGFYSWLDGKAIKG